MENFKGILIITLYGFVVGMAGTGLGGLASLFVKQTDRMLSFILGLTGGFMMFIVTFHLLPESFQLGGLYMTILGVLIGIILVILIEINIENMVQKPLAKSSLLLGISIAVHNFPEGLALGSSFLTGFHLGPSLSLAILLHNIPEGMSVSIPLRINKLSPWKIIFYTVLTGIPTGIGAFIGAYMGTVSSTLIAICLSLAGGTMLYIIADEIIPGAKTLHRGRSSSIGVVLGFLVGVILYF